MFQPKLLGKKNNGKITNENGFRYLNSMLFYKILLF